MVLVCHTLFVQPKAHESEAIAVMLLRKMTLLAQKTTQLGHPPCFAGHIGMKPWQRSAVRNRQPAKGAQNEDRVSIVCVVVAYIVIVDPQKVSDQET